MAGELITLAHGSVYELHGDVARAQGAQGHGDAYGASRPQVSGVILGVDAEDVHLGPRRAHPTLPIGQVAGDRAIVGLHGVGSGRGRFVEVGHVVADHP